MNAEKRAQLWLAERPQSLKPWLDQYSITFPDSEAGNQCQKGLNQLDYQGFIDQDVLQALGKLWRACRISWTEYADLDEMWPRTTQEIIDNIEGL